MAAESPKRNLENEFDELKSKMELMMKMMEQNFKMKGVAEEGNVSMPIMIGTAEDTNDPTYGLPYHLLPEGFEIPTGLGSNFVRPLANHSVPNISIPSSQPPVGPVVMPKSTLNPQEPQTGIYTFTSPVMHHEANLEKLTTAVSPEMEDVKKKQLMLEEQMRLLQGRGGHGPVGIGELSLAPEILLPKDFKLPDFVKYDGASNPRIHLKSYCTKMGVWSRDEKFFMHFFPESLTGPAADWYWRLDHKSILTWEHLADEFLKQYSFNESIAPTRTQLEAAKKGSSESFREYTQKWRILAAQVQPPLSDEEMIEYFLKVLPSPFVEMLSVGVYNSFAEMIPVGERIEKLHKSGKLGFVNENNQGQGKLKSFAQGKKKEGEDSFVNALRPQGEYYHNYPQVPYQTQQYYQPRPAPTSFNLPYQTNLVTPPYPNNPPPRSWNIPRNQPFKNPNFDEPFPNIPMTKAELLQQLSAANILKPIQTRPLEPPYPHWYKPNLTCDYHGGNIGHSIETCPAFKRDVLRLIKTGMIELQTVNNAPNVATNPLPNHNIQQ